jgi:hypothetical protein
MLRQLKSWWQPAPPAPAAAAEQAPPPLQIDSPGAAPLPLAAVLRDAGGFPMLDWSAVQAWVQTLPEGPAQAAAWSASELAWLAHLRVALGAGYRLRAQGSALLLSCLPSAQAEATLGFVNRSLQRILRLLEGLAVSPEWGHEILIVFDDDESYYRYVAPFYPDAGGEFAASSGMYLNAGCGHFVTFQGDMPSVEPVIVHELTHACLAHLSLPAWLNEGLAVNTEQRLCGFSPSDPRRMQERHRRFWGADEVQGFWSGQSFLRNDDGNELSYDLARILVAQFAADWPRFRAFARAASLDDGGSAAARTHLGLDLGAALGALLEREPDPAWTPRPETWNQAPERGAF